MQVIFLLNIRHFVYLLTNLGMVFKGIKLLDVVLNSRFLGVFAIWVGMIELYITKRLVIIVSQFHAPMRVCSKFRGRTLTILNALRLVIIIILGIPAFLFTLCYWAIENWLESSRRENSNFSGKKFA